MILSSLIYVGLLLDTAVRQGGATAQSANPELQEQIKHQYEKELRITLRHSSARYAIDLNSSVSPQAMSFSDVTPWPERRRFLGLIWWREIVNMDGGFAIVRSAKSADTPENSYRSVLDWLSSAPADELATLCGRGVPFQHLSEPSKTFFAARCRLPGVQQKLANGDFASAAVRFTFVAEAQGSDGKAIVAPLDPFLANSESEQKYRDELAKSYVPPRTTSEPLERIEGSGPLQFGEGKVLSIAEVCEMAERVFQRTLLYDRRLKESLTFWKGSFDLAAFMQYLKALQTTIQPILLLEDLTPLQSVISNMIRDKLAPLLPKSDTAGHLSYASAWNGRTLAAAEVLKMFPRFANRVTTGLAPDAKVTIRTALHLQICGIGSYGGGSGTSPVANVDSTVIRF